MQPLVSVITPCYNAEAYIARFIKSVLNQTWGNLELIIVNDGSTDDTEAICTDWIKKAADMNIKVTYIKKENGGAASAINAGLKVFTGEYLVWPDCDDMLTNDSIEKRVEFLEKNPQYGIVRSDASVVKEDNVGKEIGRVSNRDANRFNNMIFEELLLEKTFCTSGCYMVRRSVLLDCIPNLCIYCSRFGQNWQLLLPITLKHMVGYIDLPLYIYVIRSSSHSHMAKSYEDRLRVLEGQKCIIELALETLDIDHLAYHRMIEAKYAQKRFNLSVKYGNKKQALVEYGRLKEYGESNWQTCLLIIVCRNMLLVRIMLSLRSLAVLIQKYLHSAKSVVSK